MQYDSYHMNPQLDQGRKIWKPEPTRTRIGPGSSLENHDWLGLRLLKYENQDVHSFVDPWSEMNHCIIQLTVLLFQSYSLPHPNAFLSFLIIA